MSSHICSHLLLLRCTFIYRAASFRVWLQSFGGKERSWVLPHQATLFRSCENGVVLVGASVSAPPEALRPESDLTHVACMGFSKGFSKGCRKGIAARPGGGHSCRRSGPADLGVIEHRG
jgi:hypothetical protein